MTENELKEMARTIRVVATYMERRSESPLCASDLRRVAQNLESLWADNTRLQATNAELWDALEAILNEVDYTTSKCGLADPISGVLPRILISKAYNAILKARGG